MPSKPEITDTSDVAAGALPAAFLSLIRESATAEYEFKLWNDRLGGAPGASTLRNAFIEPLYRETALGQLSRDNEYSIRQWFEIKFTGTVDDPTNGATEVTPGDNAAYSDDDWVGMGGDTPYLLRYPISPQVARHFKLRMNPKGFGESESISRIVLKITADHQVWRLPLFAGALTGERLIPEGGGKNELIRAPYLRGMQLLAGTTADTLLIEEGVFMLNKYERVEQDRFMTGAYNLTAGDAVVLDGTVGTKEEYKVLISRKSDTSASDSTGITSTKGNAAGSGDSRLPALPAGEVMIGYATLTYAAGLPVFAGITSTTHHSWGYVVKGLASPGLTARLGPFLGTLGNNAQVEDASEERSAVNGTRYWNLDASRVSAVEASTAGGVSGKMSLAQIIAAGGDITSIEPMAAYRAPNLALSSRWLLEDEAHGDDRDYNDDIYVYGRLMLLNSGPIVAGGATLSLQDVGGHILLGKVTVFTVQGDIDVATGANEKAISYTGAEAAPTEVITISAATDPTDVDFCPWWRTRMGYGGRTTNSPDVTLTGINGLNIETDVYAASLEHNGFVPFQIRWTEIDVLPNTDLATFRFRLYKVGRTAITTIFDTSTISGLSGTSGRAFTKKWKRIPRITTTVSGGNSDVPREDAPAECRIDALNREGIYGLFSGVADIQKIKIRTYIERTLTP